MKLTGFIGGLNTKSTKKKGTPHAERITDYTEKESLSKIEQTGRSGDEKNDI